MQPEQAPVRLRDIFRVFFLVGASSFGGGISGWIHREVAHKQRWIGDKEMLAGIALAQIVPGATVTNLCVYVGQRLRGLPGALTALIALISVPFVATILAYLAWDRISSIPALQDIVDGIAAAAVGLNLRIAVVGTQRSFPKIVPMLVLTATFMCVGVLQWPLMPVMAVMIPLSIAFAWPRKTANA